VLFKDLGRIRDIHTGPDGNIYIAIDRFGKFGQLVRLVPAAK
jgi:glucose/arabinose dehydrogenase